MIWRRCIPALILLIAVSLAASAQEKKKVAKVLSIEGAKKLQYKFGSDKWFDAFVNKSNFLTEHLKTDADTMATIEFDIGGQA